MPRTIDIEGLTPTELLALGEPWWSELILSDEPFVFRAGSATILGRFSVVGDRLVIELAQIDGGGEGVLPLLWGLARRLARQRGLAVIDWRVHAVNCADPNAKLRRVLVARGFTIEELEGVGEVYRLQVT